MTDEQISIPVQELVQPDDPDEEVGQLVIEWRQPYAEWEAVPIAFDENSGRGSGLH